MIVLTFPATTKVTTIGITYSSKNLKSRKKKFIEIENLFFIQVLNKKV